MRTGAVSLEPIDRLLRRLAGADERTLLAAATECFVELMGDEGACVLLDPRPRVVVSTGQPAAEGEEIGELEPEVKRAIEGGDLLVVDHSRHGTIAILPIAAAGRRFGALVARS